MLNGNERVEKIVPDRLAVVLETAVDGIIIIDDGGRISAFNRACETLFGYEASEVIGKNVKLLMPTPYREEHDTYLGNYLRTGERKIIGIGREVIGQRKDGSTFPMELSVGEASHEGERLFVGIIRDISERKAAVSQLQESESRLRTVIDTAVDGVIIINDQALIEAFNPACEKLFGYRAGDVVGQNVKILMPQPYHDEHDGYMENYRKTGVRRIIGIGREVLGQRKDGTTFPMELSVGEARQGGKPVFVGIIRDITERKAAEQAIQRSVTELTEFAYSIAHDLKAPLRAMQGFSTALQEDYGEALDDIAEEYLNHIAAGATRMGHMIDDLLEYSRMGREDLPIEMLDVRQMVSDVVTSLNSSIEDRAALVKVDGDWCDVEGQASILTSVLQNLIANGLKFVDANTRAQIDIAGALTPGGLEIAISDNGIGIPDDCHDKIFQIFHRLNDRSDYPGTGVGLAMVKKGVVFHHGSVSVTSKPGEGSTFTIRLPYRQPD